MSKDQAQEIESLHNTLENMGVNSRGTTDVYGREFLLPVDAEHKSKIFGVGLAFIKGAPQPHLRAFWAATFGFFSCFFSVFAPAALIPYMKAPKEEGGIGLEAWQIRDANSAAVASTILMRMLCGWMCDVFGARKTFIILLLAACPGIVGLIFAQTGDMLIFGRLIIGLGLATFVTCQVWASQMFNKSVVGFANATCGGWGNLGGGVTQLVMPYVTLALISIMPEGPNEAATEWGWRLSFLLPLLMHLVSALFVLTGRDLPDGNIKQLEKSGVKKKASGALVAKLGFSNLNAWILFWTYGMCFGVELCMNSKAVNYFYTYFGVNPQTAGVLGSCFGLMNIFARSWGGLLSDACNKKCGMRGRLWSLWVIQTLEGLMCVLLGAVTYGQYHNPHTSPDGMVPGTWTTTVATTSSGVIIPTEVTYTFNSTGAMLPKCGSKKFRIPTEGWIDFDTSPTSTLVPQTDFYGNKHTFIMIKDSGSYDMPCVCNEAPLGLVMIIMICFSCLVQMAEGLHYGVVPYVSRQALGVVSGMVGAGGNFGAVIGIKYIIGVNGGGAGVDYGFIRLGITIMTTSLVMFFIYFPEWGGMLCSPKCCGSFDMQLIQPPADAQGADQMNYESAKKSDESTNVPATPETGQA